ncbi:hypothetical protein Sjap_006164 [Stephania japonica]|uniref:Uncharacterized protein n=1 Tax=Stephania japonica TaxID=461633 RepID=A0AAP0PMJ7_9MAGN
MAKSFAFHGLDSTTNIDMFLAAGRNKSLLPQSESRSVNLLKSHVILPATRK